MDKKQLAEYVDQQRWLINNGLISDDVKNQLFFCGSIVHKDVRAVELDIDVDTKSVEYKIYLDKDLINKIEKYHQLSKSTSLFGLWRFKRLLKKEGSLDFSLILSKFVRDFCGPKWNTSVQVIDFSTYVEELGAEGEKPGTGQQPNKLSD
jgi:hypothetical protein